MIAVCIASGPSLTLEDVTFCKGKATVYAVNDTYRLAPWADVLYACDEDWWDYHHEATKAVSSQKWSMSPVACRNYGLNYVKGKGKPALWSSEPDWIATGGNSGFQALNLAAVQGHSTVVLLGYDMQVTDAKRHWFGEHPKELNRGSNYREWVQHFHKAAPFISKDSIKVLNASRSTAIGCFERVTIQEALNGV